MAQILLGLPVVVRQPLEEAVPGGHVGREPRRRRGFGPDDLGGDGGGQVGRDLVLHREEIADVAVVAAGPELLAGLRRDQLGGDADLGSGAPHRTLDQIGGVDLPRDQAGADVVALEGEGRVAAQHAIEGLQRQRVDQILGQAVGEIFVLGVAEIGEGQHADDRGPVLLREGGCLLQRGRKRRCALGRPGPDADRILDVLEAVVAGIDQRHGEMLACLLVGLGRYREAAGARHGFEADGNVDIVTEDLVLVGDDVTHMDAEPELHGAIGGQMMITLRHQRLHRDRGLGGADDARELQQEAVAGVLHDAAAMIEDDGVDRAAMGLEGGMGAGLVAAHHARIAGDIGADDGGQTSFHIPELQETCKRLGRIEDRPRRGSRLESRISRTMPL